MHTVTQIRADGRKIRLLFPETTGPEVLAHLSLMLNAIAQKQLEEGGIPSCPSAFTASIVSPPKSRS